MQQLLNIDTFTNSHNFLGFGAKNGKAIVDNVMLLDIGLISSIATHDTASSECLVNAWLTILIYRPPQ
ncbi:MAG: hypothetical protein V7K71_06780 [Nostoc sp.]|uniref:hypothetical protein n=1 Tax=Nostoc sp. TaxID=1180 RepID=UPI002FF55E26